MQPHADVECPFEYHIEMVNGVDLNIDIISYDGSTGEFVFEAMSNFD